MIHGLSIAACLALVLPINGAFAASQVKRSLLRGSALETKSDVFALPSVPCVRVISLGDSDVRGLIKREVLDPYGLASRTVVQTEQRNPMGNVGAFRAHVRAWNAALAMHCRRLLVFEDDAYFETEIADVGLARAEAFLKLRQPFDLLFLGFTIPETGRGPDPVNGCRIGTSAPASCVHQLHGWLGAHAYIISGEAMQRWRHWEPRLVPANGTHGRLKLDTAIDTMMSRDDRDGFFAIRPMIAFQRMHNSSIEWGENHTRQQTIERLRSSSAWVHTRESQMLYGDVDASGRTCASASSG